MDLFDVNADVDVRLNVSADVDVARGSPSLEPPTTYV